MRKRRRLADKLTIMVCAVLVAVSAFFYAPMDVEAEEVSTSINVSPIELSGNDFHELDIPAVEAGLAGYNNGYVSVQSSVFDLIDESLDLDEFYAVTVNGLVTVRSDSTVYLRNSILSYSSDSQTPPFLFFKCNPGGSTGDSMTSYYNISTVLYCYGRDLVNKRLFFDSRTLSLVPDAINFTFDFDIKVSSVVKLTGSESASYQQGYNAGYSAGEQVGESNGYSNGYSDGFEAGEQSGYDSGFQAGQDSVDTESYYDAGYSAGYDAGYLSGYDVGYDDGYNAGWSAYEAQMDKWGADTNQYPSLVFHYLDSESGIFYGGSFGGSSAGMESAVDLLVSESFETDFVINPNHTYRISVLIDNLQYAYTQNRIVCTSNTSFITVGGISYLIHSSYPYEPDDITSTFYLPGNSMASVLSFDFIYNSAVTYGLTMPEIFYDQFGFYIYDMGPSGDTQNHIANQTDQLTGGFNDSQGNSVNNQFSSGLNDFETAEDSLFATATSGLKDFTFFDIQSVPAMVTGMSFVGSIMSGWFTQAGGTSGVGIVLSILFSIMLVAMVLGLYRWYQSKGGKD